MIGHGTADFQALAQQQGPQLGHQLFAGIGPATIAPCAHAAGAALTGEMAPCAGEAGERILHAGECDLKHRLAGLSAVGKDLEDDLLPVDHGELGQFLPVALLRGGQGFVEDDDVAALGFGEIDQFFGFAAAQ